MWWAIIRRRKIRSASTPVAALSSSSWALVAMPGIVPSAAGVGAEAWPLPTQAIGARLPVWDRPHCRSHPYICPACCCWLVMMS